MRSATIMQNTTIPNMGLSLLFFRGHGIVPVLVRLCCWQWWLGQRWCDVPAHVSIWDRAEGIEYEAIVSGIHSSTLPSLDGITGLIDNVVVVVPGLDQSRHWLTLQVGKPYGFLAAAATGLGILSPPALDLLWLRIWANLAGGRSGRTAPLDCSLLAQMALIAGGLDVPGRADGLPVSPNDLMMGLKGL